MDTEDGGGKSMWGGDDTEEPEDMADDEDGSSADPGADLKQKWREQQDDVLYPDEVRSVPSLLPSHISLPAFSKC